MYISLKLNKSGQFSQKKKKRKEGSGQKDQMYNICRLRIFWDKPHHRFGALETCVLMYVRLGMMHVQERGALFHFSILEVVVNHRILSVIGHLLLHIENS